MPNRILSQESRRWGKVSGIATVSPDTRDASCPNEVGAAFTASRGNTMRKCHVDNYSRRLVPSESATRFNDVHRMAQADHQPLLTFGKIMHFQRDVDKSQGNAKAEQKNPADVLSGEESTGGKPR